MNNNTFNYRIGKNTCVMDLAVSDTNRMAIAQRNELSQLGEVMNTITVVENKKTQTLMLSKKVTNVKMDFLQETLCVQSGDALGFFSHAGGKVDKLGRWISDVAVQDFCTNGKDKIATVAKNTLAVFDLEQERIVQHAWLNYPQSAEYNNNQVYFYDPNYIATVKNATHGKNVEIARYDVRQKLEKPVQIYMDKAKNCYSSALLNCDSNLPTLALRHANISSTSLVDLNKMQEQEYSCSNILEYTPQGNDTYSKYELELCSNKQKHLMFLMHQTNIVRKSFQYKNAIQCFDVQAPEQTLASKKIEVSTSKYPPKVAMNMGKVLYTANSKVKLKNVQDFF